MDRRSFLKGGLGAMLSGGMLTHAVSRFDSPPGIQSIAVPRPPAFSVIPVVGDGNWIWNGPPTEQTGYLEPRQYRLKVGIEMEGLGGAAEIISTTTAPVEHPEQKIEQVELETHGCQAALRLLAPGAGQLVVTAAQLAKGQVISAAAHYKLTLSKQHHGYQPDQFPVKQKLPLEIERGFLQDSPGIQTKSAQARTLCRELSTGLAHPWEIAKAFAEWIPRNIQPQIGSYTSVTTALETRRGDCEEMAGLFVALCRAAGIPARLVWVPNHTWAEFYLVDREGQGRWIPAHTACYLWFGYTGAHELVLQKGDRVDVPERHKRLRLLEDWTQFQGRGPRIRYTAELTPLAAPDKDDAGPGTRTKDDTGEWKCTGSHPLDRYQRR